MNGNSAEGLDLSDTFGYHSWKVQELVSGVSSGQIRLPDIQRPFVWSNSKVRDLIDSMYHGFPVGQLMFWVSSDDSRSRAIGPTGKTQAGTMQVIDGQQRLTSLYAVVEGVEVLREDYSQERIVVAFNPLTERFAIPDSAIRRSSEWIQDIRDVFDDPIEARHAYIQKLRASRSGEATEPDLEQPIDERSIELTLGKLASVLKYEFQVVQLKDQVHRETVADVFVRINSEGVKLSSTDFILTWLSVFWEEGRQELEDFARASRFTAQEMSRLTKQPVTWTPQNPYLTLDPGQVLRVVVAVGNRRARLQDAYNALRGRDPRTRQIIRENRERELAHLKDGQARVLNPNNWDEFLKVIERAGIRTSSMVTSKNAILYTYAMWLIGRTEFNVPIDELRELMARWYFMAQITGRFSTSPETRAQQDLNRLDGLDRTPDEFKKAITTQVDTILTEDWWSVTLPEDLNVSGTSGPAYIGYMAALTILDADVLLSNLKVKDWLDPGRRPRKGLEKHHLFPKAHLKKFGITKPRQTNQAANYALVEWSDNIDISGDDPGQYWPAQVTEKNLQHARLAQQMWWHALPENWTNMSYAGFLQERRNLIAAVTREGFNKLSDPNYQPQLYQRVSAASEPTLLHFDELVLAGFIPPGTLLTPTDGQTDSIAEVTEDATIVLDDTEYRTPDLAARGDGAVDADGWQYWTAVLDEPVRLADIRASAEAQEAIEATGAE